MATRRIVRWYAPVLYRSQSQRSNEGTSSFCFQNFFSLSFSLTDQTLRSLPRFSSILFNRAAIKLPVSSHEIRKNWTDLVIAHLLISRDKSFVPLFYLYVTFILFKHKYSMHSWKCVFENLFLWKKAIIFLNRYHRLGNGNG